MWNLDNWENSFEKMVTKIVVFVFFFFSTRFRSWCCPQKISMHFIEIIDANKWNTLAILWKHSEVGVLDLWCIFVHWPNYCQFNEINKFIDINSKLLWQTTNDVNVFFFSTVIYSIWSIDSRTHYRKLITTIDKNTTQQNRIN